MSDLHTPAVSSIDFSDLCPAIRDAIKDSLAEIVRIQNDEAPPAAERFEHYERRTQKACMELGRRVLQEVLEDQDAQLPEAGKATLKAEIERKVERIRELAETRCYC